MPLTFKISFEKIDFKDEEFITDIAKVEEFYNAGIVLEYKQNKEKLTKKFSSNSKLMQFIEMDENDSIKYFMNFCFCTCFFNDCAFFLLLLLPSFSQQFLRFF